ncbi:MAG: glycosyltransferase [Acidobacteria bacterium]|nr:glycosyltransferase [Acidobacteriota bacterium]MBI3656476.1 glycosyltransferase [Acidobacteriota bacterium]
MKILHTVQLYYPNLGGSEEVVKQLSERLVARGHTVTVATAVDSRRSFAAWNGVAIKGFRISGNATRGLDGDVQPYVDFLRQNDCDVMMNYAAQIWSTDLAFPLLNTLKCKKVFVPCGYSALHDSQYRQYFSALPQYLRQYDRVVHLSPNYRDAQFSQAHGLQNSIIIPNGAAEEEFLTPALGFRQRYGIGTKYMILCVANHYQLKGHGEAIRWFGSLNPKEATLVIIGQPVAGECYTDCSAQAAAAANVRLLADVPREWVVSAYKEADLFLLGSQVECFPLVILEAMAAKTPFLSTNVGNVAELSGGIVSRPENMVAHLQGLLDNAAQRRELGEAGHREWLAKYTWTKVVDQYENLYRALMDEAKASHDKSSVAGVGTLPPTVSVIVPCYNHAEYLPESVESIINQTYQDFEIILMNDGSTDRTQAVAEQLIKKYPAHRLTLVNQPNQGLVTARNNAIRDVARGKYLLPLDADDMIRTTFLEETVKVLDSRPDVGVVYTFQQRFGEENGCYNQEIFELKELLENNRLNYCSLFRKTVWQKAGGYNANMKWGYEDWDFWISCAESGARFEVVRQHLFLYRIRPQSMYSESVKRDLELRAQITRNHRGLYSDRSVEWADLYQEYLKNPDDVELNARLMNQYLNKQNWPEAIPHMIKCLWQYPDNADLQTMLGVGCLKLGDARNAEAYLQKVVDQQPNNFNALFNLGISKLFQERDDEAERHFMDVVELRPDWPDTYAVLASLCLLKGRVSEAEAILADALNFAPCLAPINRFMEDMRRNPLETAKAYLELIIGQNTNYTPQPMLEAKPGLAADCVWESPIMPAAGVNGGGQPGVADDAHGQRPSPLAHTSGSGVQPAVNVPTSSPLPAAAHRRAPAPSEVIVKPAEAPYECMVSVIIPTYNRPEMLVETIKSVLNQSYRDFEIIVVNDAGSDVSDVVEFLDRENRITYLRHSRNRGLAAARNSGIKLARGKYLAYLDDDDVFYSNHLETLVSFLEVNPGRAAYVDALSATQVWQNTSYQTVAREIVYSSEFSSDVMLTRNFIPVLCVMHEKACLDAVGLFDESLEVHEDWDMWIRIGLQFGMTHIKTVTAEFRKRMDGSNATTSINKQLAFLQTADRIYEKYRAYAARNPAVRHGQQEFRRILCQQADLAELKMKANAAPFQTSEVCS